MLQKLIKDNYNLYEIIPGKLIYISNIDEKINIWKNEYFNHHKIYSPSITSGGSNLLAVKNGFNIPFIKSGKNDYLLI